MDARIKLGTRFTIEMMNDRLKGTMGEGMGIEFISLSDYELVARMPVDSRNIQPLGRLNGGASLALAEIAGSTAANLHLDTSVEVALGLDLNANHVRGLMGGEGVYVLARVTAHHIGRKTSVWQISIENPQGELVCISRLTMVVVPRAEAKV